MKSKGAMKPKMTPKAPKMVPKGGKMPMMPKKGGKC